MSTVEVNDARQIKRLNRRETRSGRAALSVAAAGVLLLMLLWLAVELVLSVLGRPALLISPAELVTGAASIATATVPGVLTAAGVIMALLGAALLAAALLPGTKPRHIMANQRAAMVVDSEVVAAAASRAARTAAHLAPDQVSSRVGHRRIEVLVRPTSGRAVDVGAIKEAVEQETAGYGLRPSLAINVTTGGKTVMGS